MLGLSLAPHRASVGLVETRRVSFPRFDLFASPGTAKSIRLGTQQGVSTSPHRAAYPFSQGHLKILLINLDHPAQLRYSRASSAPAPYCFSSRLVGAIALFSCLPQAAFLTNQTHSSSTTQKIARVIPWVRFGGKLQPVPQLSFRPVAPRRYRGVI